jgi:hypothetical protein
LSTEAEYKSLSDLGRDIAWFANLLRETQIMVIVENIKVAVDNKGAIDLANSETLQNSFRTKHMDIWLHFVRELITVKLIKLKYTKTTSNAADFLTKALGRSVIKRSLSQLSVLQISRVASHLATRSMAGCQIMDAGENLGPARKIQKLDPTVNHGESFSSTAW